MMHGPINIRLNCKCLRSDGMFYAFGAVYEVSETKHRNEKAKTVHREVLYSIRQVILG